MNNPERNRKVSLFVGSPRSGKTFLANKFVLMSKKNDVIVFNWGGLKRDFETLEPAHQIYKHHEKKNQLIAITDAVTVGGDRVPIFHGNKPTRYKIMLFDSKKQNQSFIDSFIHQNKKHGNNTKFMVDDASQLYNSGTIDGAMNALLSKATHFRVDVFLIFHSLNYVPKQVFQYVDNLYLFKENTTVDYSRKNSLPYFQKIKEIQTDVKNAPKYSFTIINLKGDRINDKPEGEHNIIKVIHDGKSL